MIVYKNNWFCTNSDYPNEDWVGDADYVVGDGSELARKILEYAPNFSLVTDKDNGTLIDVIPTEITAAELDKYKALKIAKTKESLYEWLANNPMLYSDGNYYSVTEEKQSLLNSNLASYERATAAGIPYPLKWNSTGAECTEWEYADLIALSLSIAAYVAPKVSTQQAVEGQIRACETKEEVDGVVISYE